MHKGLAKGYATMVKMARNMDKERLEARGNAQ